MNGGSATKDISIGVVVHALSVEVEGRRDEKRVENPPSSKRYRAGFTNETSMPTFLPSR